MRRLSGALALAVLATCATSVASAHSLHTNTARITLRDGHVQVDLQVDLLGFLARLDEHASTLSHARAGAPTGKGSQVLAAGRRAFLAEAALLVDGRRIPLTPRTFPNVNELAHLIMAHHTGASAHDGEPMLVPIRLEAKLETWEPRTLSLEAPHELAPLLVTFVQPQTQLSSRTGRASFTVLRRGQTGKGEHGVLLLTVTGAALAAFLLLMARATRRRTSHSSGTVSVV